MLLTEIATKADIEEILKAIAELRASIEDKKIEQLYLRSADVKKLLNISDGTLQRLRISKALIANKINGTWFYKSDDVHKMIDQKQTKNK